MPIDLGLHPTQGPGPDLDRALRCAIATRHPIISCATVCRVGYDFFLPASLIPCSLDFLFLLSNPPCPPAFISALFFFKAHRHIQPKSPLSELIRENLRLFSPPSLTPARSPTHTCTPTPYISPSPPSSSSRQRSTLYETRGCPSPAFTTSSLQPSTCWSTLATCLEGRVYKRLNFPGYSGPRCFPTLDVERPLLIQGQPTSSVA